MSNDGTHVLAFGDKVRIKATGAGALVIRSAYRFSGGDDTWLVDIILAGEHNMTLTKFHADAVELDDGDRPWLTEDEFQRRLLKWIPDGELSDERTLGRLEGQAMQVESTLYRLTGLGFSTQRVTALLHADMRTHDLLIEYARDKRVTS